MTAGRQTRLTGAGPRDVSVGSGLPRVTGGFFTSSLAIAAYFALCGVVIHLLTNGRYGYFRDELYYLDCGEHLDWGYVDLAPLVALVAKFARMLLGDSLHAIRFPVTLAAGARIFLTGLIARELNGRRFAVALACLCALIAPVYLVLGDFLSMNAFESIFWMGCVYILILVLKRQNPRLLIWFGVLAGIGLENKHSMLFFGFSVAAGLLLTSDRRLFADKWIWIAGAIALALFLPNLIWQVQHHWPTLEDLTNVQRSGKNVALGPVAFIGQQILIMLPTSVLVWAAGLWFFFFDDAGKRFRALGWAYLVLLVMMIVLKGKPYYAAPAYPMLFAAGGVFWEKLANRPRLGWVAVALPAFIALTGAIVAPIFLPVLPVEKIIPYENEVGLHPSKTEVQQVGPLPQYFGDQFGWPEMVEKVAEVYNGLPADERAKAAIYAGNYGEAGAVDFFGPRYGLAKAISGHQNYYYWGPRDYSGEVTILLQADRSSAERFCSSVEDGPEVGHPYAMAEEHYRILICRGLKQPLRELWPQLKHWN